MDVRCVCVGVAFVLVCCLVRESEECMAEGVGVVVPDTMQIVDRERTELVAGWLGLFNLC